MKLCIPEEVLGQHSPGFVRAQAQMKRSGTYDSYISQLRTGGYMEVRDGLMYATQSGIELIGDTGAGL